MLNPNDQGMELVPEYTYYYENDQPLIDLSLGLEPEQQSAPSFSNPSINQLMYVANQGNRNYNQSMLQPRNAQTT